MKIKRYCYHSKKYRNEHLNVTGVLHFDNKYAFCGQPWIHLCAYKNAYNTMWKDYQIGVAIHDQDDFDIGYVYSDEWILADGENCPELGGEALFSFGEAIKYLKHGMKVARKGWNGKGQYIQLATGISYKTEGGDIVNCEHDTIGNMAIAFCGTSGVQMGWLASQADMLSEDWKFAE